jgi:hypothetical protein
VGLSRNTLLLALSSLFADISTEMLYPVLPIFLTQTLHATGSIVGLVDGFARATQTIRASASSKDQPHVHHDALEFPDGQIVLLTKLCEGQRAIVLQLPAAPHTEREAEEQKRVAIVA